MARVTVEDCVDKVPNRFELVMLAAHRAREIASGAPLPSAAMTHTLSPPPRSLVKAILLPSGL